MTNAQSSSWALGAALGPMTCLYDSIFTKQDCLHLRHWNWGHPKALPGGFENEWDRVILTSLLWGEAKGGDDLQITRFWERTTKGKWTLFHKVALRQPLLPPSAVGLEFLFLSLFFYIHQDWIRAPGKLLFALGSFTLIWLLQWSKEGTQVHYLQT